MATSLAEVRAHGRVMRYHRLGAGPPLVLLGPTGRAEELAERFRVIVPEMPAHGEDVGAWLTAFLEGLGTTGVTVFAAEPFYSVARDVALADPDRVSHVILGER
jgi:pimeloyl-ACP methyl ester carboxylesterase